MPQPVRLPEPIRPRAPAASRMPPEHPAGSRGGAATPSTGYPRPPAMSLCRRGGGALPKAVSVAPASLLDRLSRTSPPRLARRSREPDAVVPPDDLRSIGDTPEPTTLLPRCPASLRPIRRRRLSRLPRGVRRHAASSVRAGGARVAARPCGGKRRWLVVPCLLGPHPTAPATYRPDRRSTATAG